jgi:hypothetical protein
MIPQRVPYRDKRSDPPAIAPMGEGRDLQCRWIADAKLRAIPKQSLPTTMERPVPKKNDRVRRISARWATALAALHFVRPMAALRQRI